MFDFDELEDAHKHILAALHECKTKEASVVIIVLSRILAELSCKAGMPRKVLLEGISETYDMVLSDERKEAGEPH